MKQKNNLCYLQLLLLFVLPLFTSCSSKTSISSQEGYVEVEGGKIWYEVFGEGEKAPIILLHGGHGGTSLEFEPLRELGYEGPMVFLDQLGSGRSTNTIILIIRKPLIFITVFMSGEKKGQILKEAI